MAKVDIGPSSLPEQESHPTDVFVLPVTPMLGSNVELTKQLFDTLENGESKALVLIGFATGTTPTALNPFIKRTVDRGVPVFILSNNPGEESGPKRIVYGVQQDAVEAGASPLRDVNVNHLPEVLGAIQAEIDSGKFGQELSEAILEKF